MDTTGLWILGMVVLILLFFTGWLWSVVWFVFVTLPFGLIGVLYLQWEGFNNRRRLSVLKSDEVAWIKYAQLLACRNSCVTSFQIAMAQGECDRFWKEYRARKEANNG